MSHHFSARSLALSTAFAIAMGVAACTPSTEQKAASAAPSAFDIPKDVEATAKREITSATLAAPIRYLASDALEGRGPATRGDTLARLYLATELQSMGYQPAGENGGWEQPFDVVGVTAKAPETWTFTGKKGNADLKW